MMDNDLYGIGGYSDQSSMAVSPPPSVVAPADYNNLMMMMMSSSTTSTTFEADQAGGFNDDDHRVNHQGFGSDPIFHAPSSAVSDAASMAASDDVSCEIRAKIASHPLYPKLLEAYIDCRKVLKKKKRIIIINKYSKKN